MTINYPHGIKRAAKPLERTSHSYSNRGMSLEADINTTNKYYLDIEKANIHKKPTPIQIVNVDYPKRSAAVITEAYFKRPSTTDYNGIYRHKYIDFEAKETKNKTSFPLANIHEHQITHIKSISKHGGITFFIIRFTSLNETYLITSEKILPYWENHLNGGRKSIPYEEIKKYGYLIPLSFYARVDYLKVVDDLYF